MSELNKAVVENPGSCPYCDSGDLTLHSRDLDMHDFIMNTDITCDVHCGECDLEWTVNIGVISAEVPTPEQVMEDLL